MFLNNMKTELNQLERYKRQKIEAALALQIGSLIILLIKSNQ